jgi:hypothetical protein
MGSDPTFYMSCVGSLPIVFCPYDFDNNGE